MNNQNEIKTIYRYKKMLPLSISPILYNRKERYEYYDDLIQSNPVSSITPDLLNSFNSFSGNGGDFGGGGASGSWD